jgi:hypothetical protein
MAFEIHDFFMSFTPRGDSKGLFNVVKDDIGSSGATSYYCYQNEAGSYVIMRVVTSGSLTIKNYQYYGVPKRPLQRDTDWANRASLNYVEYYQLFNQS